MGRGEMVIDGMNVIGSRPDGWWRDRPEAIRRLVAAVEGYAADAGLPVTVVLEGRAFELTAEHPGVEVVFAPSRGRDAADDEIVRIVQRHPDPAGVEVVTSDAGLAERVRALGVGVRPAGGFRRELDSGPGGRETPRRGSPDNR